MTGKWEKRMWQLRTRMDRLDLELDRLTRESADAMGEGHRITLEEKEARTAMAEARSVRYAGKDGRRNKFVIDDTTISLTPIVSTLFEILCSDNRRFPDRHVDFKPIDDVVKALARQEKKKPERIRSVLKQRTYTLRNALEAHGLSRWLVEVDYERGMRFRLVRSEEDA